jgi:hypothetical protein
VFVVLTTAPTVNVGELLKSKIVTFCSVPSQAFAKYVLYVGHDAQLIIGLIGLNTK